MAKRLVLALACAVLVALPWAGSMQPMQATAQRAAAPRAPRTITLGMGYIPDVQFAPFYLADQRGYYRQAGLQVKFDYSTSPNLIQLVGAGNVDFAIADGTDVIAATAQGVPVTYVAALYQHLPAAIFSLADKNIHSVADLRGKTIGIPGRYGSLYTGLLAALHVAKLSPRDVSIRSIGYTQVANVAQGKVDAAVGYSTNEPVQLAALPQHYKVNTLQIGIETNLVGAGVIVGWNLLTHDPSLVRAFVQATLRGVADTIKNPQAAFAAARKVNGLSAALKGHNAAIQYSVLLRTMDFWHDATTRTHGLGYAEPAQWRNSERLLQAIGQVSHAPAINSIVTNRFVAGAAKL